MPKVKSQTDSNNSAPAAAEAAPVTKVVEEILPDVSIQTLIWQIKNQSTKQVNDKSGVKLKEITEVQKKVKFAHNLMNIIKAASNSKDGGLDITDLKLQEILNDPTEGLSEIEQHRNNIKQLEEQIRTDINQLKEIIEKLPNDTQQLEGEIKKLGKVIKNLTKDIADEKDTTKQVELQKQLDDTKKIKADKEAEAKKHLDDHLAKLDEEIEQLSIDIDNEKDASKQTELQVLKADKIKLKADKEKLKSTKERLKSRKEEFKSTKETLRAKKKELEPVKAELQSIIDKMGFKRDDKGNYLTQYSKEQKKDMLESGDWKVKDLMMENETLMQESQKIAALGPGIHPLSEGG